MFNITVQKWELGLDILFCAEKSSQQCIFYHFLKLVLGAVNKSVICSCGAISTNSSPERGQLLWRCLISQHQASISIVKYDAQRMTLNIRNDIGKKNRAYKSTLSELIMSLHLVFSTTSYLAFTVAWVPYAWYQSFILTLRVWVMLCIMKDGLNFNLLHYSTFFVTKT